MNPTRTLAQARRWPSRCSGFSPKRDKPKGSPHEFSLRRDAVLTEHSGLSLKRDARQWWIHGISLRRGLLAWARLCVAQDEKGSPRRVLVAGSSLVLSPRRDKLAWAKIAEFATVQPHAMAEPARIHTQTHMQLHFSQWNTSYMHINTKTTKNSQGQLKTDESSFPYLRLSTKNNRPATLRKWKFQNQGSELEYRMA